MSGKLNLDFPYSEITGKPLPTSKRSVSFFRPIIPVTLLYGQKYVMYEALIDSGADNNVFHGDIALYLGIDLKKGSKKRISGISGGLIKGYEHKLRMKLGTYEFRTKATFSSQIPDNSIAVFGNQGFFDHFNISFDYINKLVNISR
jgi:hypothetical protein